MMARRRTVHAFAFCMTVCLISLNSHGTCAAETLRVMTFNMWHGGEGRTQPLEHTLRVIEAAKADLVGLQETHGVERDGRRPDNARWLADQLSWHYFDQGGWTGVISRYPIVSHSPKKWGVAIELPSGHRVWHFNVHLASSPYQPYQLLKIPYNDAPFIATAEDAVAAAQDAREEDVTSMLAEVRDVAGQTPVFITGDFNEPSPLDWTEAAEHAGRCPLMVCWPTTAAVLEAGFVDAYREIHADPVKSPGQTWTPLTAENDPADRHDRIDFVFVGGRDVKVEAADVVGERAEYADIVVTPYPSDHRGVVATVTIE